jgi:hypothetical protein
MNILRTKRKRKVYLGDGHFFLSNCLIKHDIEGKMEGKGRRERTRKLIFCMCKKMRGCRKLKGTLSIALWGEFALGEAVELS